MELREYLEKTGNLLFRWRSYLPLIVVPFSLIALRESDQLKHIAGNTAEQIWETFSLLISFTGLFVRCMVVGFTPGGTSGRNTSKQIADTLNTKGLYSLCRHPLYLGNFLIFTGILLFVQVWWFAMISVLAFWLHYERIMLAEEAYLRAKFNDAFAEWAGKTPAFFPDFSNWIPTDLHYSFRNTLKREYTAFFLSTASFSLSHILMDSFQKDRLEIDILWVIFFFAGLSVYTVLRFLKRHSKILNVEGR